MANAHLEGSDADTYSAILDAISKLARAKSAAEREVRWFPVGGNLGVARDHHSRLELFLSGPRLVCHSETVAANLAFDSWQRANADDLQANRVVLPPGSHFDAIAAFLCTHLLDNGIATDLQAGFSKSEKVIEVALERSRLQGESLVGLLGELLFLRHLISARPQSAADFINHWFGHTRSSRDFQIGPVGVEVKTTRGATSRHHVQGVHQVERGHAVGGVHEESLYLLSIGLEPIDERSPTGGWSLPSLVDSVLALISSDSPEPAVSAQLAEAFLKRVEEYGAGEGLGYDHNQMRHRVIFGQRWAFKFARAYDMSDADISVLRSVDLANFSMVELASVSFVVSLPAQVHGDINPVVGLSPFVEQVLHQAGM